MATAMRLWPAMWTVLKPMPTLKKLFELSKNRVVPYTETHLLVVLVVMYEEIECA